MASLRGPRKGYKIEVPNPTCSLVKIRSFASPSDISQSALGFASRPLRITHLKYSSSNPCRRRPVLSSVRASVEVRVFFLMHFLLTLLVGADMAENQRKLGGKKQK